MTDFGHALDSIMREIRGDYDDEPGELNKQMKIEIHGRNKYTKNP